MLHTTALLSLVRTKNVHRVRWLGLEGILDLRLNTAARIGCPVFCLDCFCHQVKEGQEKRLDDFFSMCAYVNGPYDKVEGFVGLDSALIKIEDQTAPGKTANRVFYLALPPSVFMPVTQNIKAACMSKRLVRASETVVLLCVFFMTHVPTDFHCTLCLKLVYMYKHFGFSYLFLSPLPFSSLVPFCLHVCRGYTRVIVEKPFGRDSESSAVLSRHLTKLFKEEEMYRIDHYLGKEMVQNLMVLR